MSSSKQRKVLGQKKSFDYFKSRNFCSCGRKICVEFKGIDKKVEGQLKKKKKSVGRLVTIKRRREGIRKYSF